MEYTIDDNNIHIVDSHKISKFCFRGILYSLRDANQNSNVWKRCLTSLCCEWTCHNFLYMIGFQRDRTGSVDLDYPCDHQEWMYIVIAGLVWPFTFKTK